MRVVIALALWAACLAAAAQVPFSFGVFGDTPYHALESLAAAQLLRDMDREGMAFVVHVGDVKRAAEPCSNELFRERRELLDASPRPLVFVPGDNEWTDCHVRAAGAHDPLHRLDALRALFFGGDESLGRTRIRLARQSEDARFRPYRENTRWIAGGIVFAAFNVPGSNNNLGRNAEDGRGARRTHDGELRLARASGRGRPPAGHARAGRVRARRSTVRQRALAAATATKAGGRRCVSRPLRWASRCCSCTATGTPTASTSRSPIR